VRVNFGGSWRRPFLWRKAYSISSGSSDRIIPVLSAYRWSPELDIGIQALAAIPVGAAGEGIGESDVRVNFGGVTHQPFPFILYGQTRQVSVN
jgi:regulator of ribonuclease activity A